MNLITAIISTFFGSLSDIFFKKALQYKINLWNNDFLGQILPLIVFILAYVYIDFDFDTTLYVSPKIIFFIFLSFVVYATGRYFHAGVFKKEKITHLLPYENLSKIFTVVFSYFLFHDISFLSFCLTLATIFIIIVFSLDLKNMRFSRHILVFAFSHVLFAVGNLLTGYILLSASDGGLGVSGYSFITTYLSLGMVIYMVPFIAKKWFLELKNVDVSFYISRSLAGFLGWFSWFLSLVVISNLGLTLSVLLSFLGLLSTLFFAFFILRDVPRKRDIVLTVLVVILISFGFFLK